MLFNSLAYGHSSGYSAQVSADRAAL